ncbi:hypothetical protein [Nocardiopsis sp. ATB16-24]|uniref:hypothetical protein n=1 Tax=Nocardiopsis sp. ATB16-24 TaxID=3019555 RepID=UPI0025546277|nr:hypothetical protein [Nocardiopsis sp. ATB16-24]
MTQPVPEHRAARRTVAAMVYALAGVLTVVGVAAMVWLGVAIVQGVWAYALDRVAEGV